MDPSKNSPDKIIETYAEDMAQVIGEGGEGLVKKAIHGEEEHEIEHRVTSPESKKNRFFLFFGIALILLSVGILAFFFFVTRDDSIAVEQQFTPLVFTDRSTFLEVAEFNRESIMYTVANAVANTEVKAGGLEGMYLTFDKKVVGLRQFLSLIKSNFVLDAKTELVSDSFLIGAVNVSNGASLDSGDGFFILIQMRSIADIFESLRDWENKMFADLHGFLGINVNSSNSYLLTKGFEDGIVSNKNARVLNDTEGNPILMYVFANENSVVISDSEIAIREVVLRLASSDKAQ